jgi:hypothetical protein
MYIEQNEPSRSTAGGLGAWLYPYFFNYHFNSSSLVYQEQFLEVSRWNFWIIGKHPIFSIL